MAVQDSTLGGRLAYARALASETSGVREVRCLCDRAELGGVVLTSPRLLEQSDPASGAVSKRVRDHVVDCLAGKSLLISMDLKGRGSQDKQSGVYNHVTDLYLFHRQPYYTLQICSNNGLPLS